MKQVVLTYFIIVQKNLAALRETPWFFWTRDGFQPSAARPCAALFNPATIVAELIVKLSTV